MSGLKAKLTQKIGPLPAFAWALILVVGFLVYRKFHSSSTSTDTTTDATAQDSGIIGTGVGGDAGTVGDGTDYHEPIPLDPGQGLYDPNTRQIVTNPQAPETNVEPVAPTPPPADSSAPSPATQTAPAPHPGSSAQIVSSILHRSAISAAVRANASPAKSKPVAHVIAKTKPASPAVAKTVKKASKKKKK